MRLHELAKKYGYNQQDLLIAVQKQGFDLKDTLSTVDSEIEVWVAKQAAGGWIPPSPKKKVAKKKRVAESIKNVGLVVENYDQVKVSTAEPEVSGPVVNEEKEAQPVISAEEKIIEEVKVDASVVEPEKVVVDNNKPEILAADNVEKNTTTSKIDSVVEEKELVKSAPNMANDTVSVDKVDKEVAEATQVVRPAAVEVRGSAAVGQVSPEAMKAILRSSGKKIPTADNRKDSPRSSAGKDMVGKKNSRVAPVSNERSSPGARPNKDKATKKADVNLDSIILADVNSSLKPKPKQRIKSKAKAVEDNELDQEVLDKKNKVTKKIKSKEIDDWGIDDLSDGIDDVEEALIPIDKDVEVLDNIDNDLIAKDNRQDELHSGFKHKRADFKSKKTQHDLPASFAEIDNEFTRTLTGGSSRRRSTRGAGVRGRRSGRGKKSSANTMQKAVEQKGVVHLGMTVRELSVALGVKLQQILAYLMNLGQMSQVNDILSAEDVTAIAEEFKIPITWESSENLEEELEKETLAQEHVDDESKIITRPPIVTFMGHVDHGKTSLLDWIRHTRVASKEHGGITQHIGAYSVLHDGKRIAFLDTPGHEAFSTMRARGANLTDIAVLIVAADDGVMPQTEEAIAHARSANVPIVVAINKCDLPSANPDKVRQELANRTGLLPEEWGGQVGMVEVSAITGKGLDDLLERILLEAEVLELKANPERLATGFVIEANIVEGQGVVATALVSDGTLRRGDSMLCSNAYGKIRLMYNEFGETIDSAGPGMPVRISGLSSVPEAGERFFVLQDLLKARNIAEQREREARSLALAKRKHVTLENFTSHLDDSGRRELNIIVKADVMGSIEVLEKTLNSLSNEEVGINILHSAVGGINQADVILADASDAVVVGFHVAADSNAKSLAINLGVQIKTYHVIYRLLEDMKAALEGLLPPEEKEVVQGHAEIRQVFRASKIGAIAGSYVTDGSIFRTSKVRLYRNNIVVYDGTIQTLKRIQDDAREVKSGFECGIKINGYDDIKEGDIIEAYIVEEIARKLS